MVGTKTTYRPLGEVISLAIMLLRGGLYFILRFRRPHFVLMDRGARIKGLHNIVFNGPAKLGAHTLLDARYSGPVRLGRNFSLGDFSILRCSGSSSFHCPGASIGDFVSFGPYCNIGGGYGLRIGDHNLFGPYVSIHPEYHLSADLDAPIRTQGISGEGVAIGEDNWFGTKATVLDGVVLANGNIVAAGAVLARGSYNSRGIYGGLPAKLISKRK